MYGCPPTGGAVKELIDYKRREAKNQGSDHNFVKPNRAALFRGHEALSHIICHGNLLKLAMSWSLGVPGGTALIEINFPRSGRKRPDFGPLPTRDLLLADSLEC
jgi:hypothetical protein